jgi:hypothetical protein
VQEHGQAPYRTLDSFIDAFDASLDGTQLKQTFAHSEWKWLASVGELQLFLQRCKHAGNVYAHSVRPYDVRSSLPCVLLPSLHSLPCVFVIQIAEALNALACKAAENSGIKRAHRKKFLAWLKKPQQKQAIDDEVRAGKKQFDEKSAGLRSNKVYASSSTTETLLS